MLSLGGHSPDLILLGSGGGGRGGELKSRGCTSV